MTDGIIKGTGNSRFLKGPADILSKYPTWEAAAAALAAGTFAVDLNGINAAGWTTQGTALNKANLLTDALCTALGLATTATPTQAMEKLRTLISAAQTTANGKGYSASGSYVGNGGYGVNSPNTLTFPFEASAVFIAGNNYVGILLDPAGFSTINYNSSQFLQNNRLITSFSANTVSWYAYGTSANYVVQLNDQSITYHYAAFG